jgi:hypothetical protein
MAMSSDGMADMIYSEMEKEYWPDTPLLPQAEAETKRYYKVIATAVINHLKANCDVLPGSFNIPSEGSVTGIGKLS